MSSQLPQRQCVFLIGDKSSWLSSLNDLIGRCKQNSLIVGDIQFDNNKTVSYKQAQQQLGKEFSCIVFDASEQLYPDSFGAIMGTLTAGGVLFVLLDEANTNYQRRFQKIAQQACEQAISFHWCESETDLAAIELAETTVNSFSQTDDQQKAVDAIIKVMTGHRKRPLVLTSDRGRGKTAALGIAAAELLKRGKQHILVTAPSLATVDTLFKHAQQELADATYIKGVLSLANAEIRFIAPDLLIETVPKADLLMIDEAAAIPSFMLEAMLKHYSRLVFASTLHGYEGTGRGFALRFQQTLQQYMPDWRLLTMQTPIRWADDDQLEPFSFEALLLDAEPVADELVVSATVENVELKQLNQAELSNNEEQLRQLFGLMALAHYRTRPSDLQLLLDSDDVSIFTLTYNDHIVASAWLIEEGGLDEKLSQAIYNGTRRPNGDLLPQSLLAHSGITTAGQYHYQRIARIAVHPAIQKQGLGSFFIKALTEKLRQQTDCLGASFAASDNLLSFWLKAGFNVVRLGQQQDEVSGSQAVMVLKSCSEKGQLLIEKAQSSLQQQWPFLLHASYKKVKPELLLAISQALPNKAEHLSDDILQQIKGFAFEQRAYESSQFSLWQWALSAIHQAQFRTLSKKQQSMVMMLLLQQYQLNEVVDVLGFTGRKQLIAELRQVVQQMLTCRR